VIDRVMARLATGGDASDASAEIVRRQLAAREPITAAELAAVGLNARRVPVGEPDLSDPAFALRLATEARRD